MTPSMPAPDALALPAPTIPGDHSSLVSWAYNEYCRQQEAGIAPDPDEYCARFPSIQAELAQMLSVHRLVHGDSHFTDAPAVRWPEPGEEFVGFRLERELGRGRFSHVFLATEPALGHRRVVVKIAQCGMDEALTLGRLAHPNIVPIFSVRKDEATGLSAVCMPYLGEATLCDLLARVLAGPALPRSASAVLDAAAKGYTAEPPTATDAASAAFLRSATYLDGIRRLAVQLLDALAFIHAEGVCHRDLKPSNVLLTRAGVPMLLDFNLSGDVRHMRVGLGGTPTYMAPEQLQRLGSNDGSGLDGRADLFSLGVILYELLTGRRPFTAPPSGVALAETRQFLLERHAVGAAAVRSHNPAVDRALANLVDRCLALIPANRPASAQAARALLEAPARRRRMMVMSRRGLALAMALPLLLSGGMLWHAMTLSPATLAGTVTKAVDEFALSQEAFRAGDYPEARRHLDDHLRAHPEDARGWFRRGVISLKLQQSNLAIMDFREAHRLKPDGLTKACLGYAYTENNQRKESRYYFEQAITAGYETPIVLNDLGYLLLKDGALADAQRILTYAINAAPSLQAAYHNRGLVYIQQAILRPVPAAGAPDAGARNAKASRGPDVRLLQLALSDFTQALVIGPASGELYHSAALACAYLSGHDPARAPEAIEHLANAIRHGLDRDAAGQRPFPKYLGKLAAYHALRAEPQVAHPHAFAQRFLAVPLE